eukprot:5070055-Amphidinium_carterae.1
MEVAVLFATELDLQPGGEATVEEDSSMVDAGGSAEVEDAMDTSGLSVADELAEKREELRQLIVRTLSCQTSSLCFPLTRR